MIIIFQRQFLKFCSALSLELNNNNNNKILIIIIVKSLLYFILISFFFFLQIEKMNFEVKSAHKNAFREIFNLVAQGKDKIDKAGLKKLFQIIDYRVSEE